MALYENEFDTPSPAGAAPPQPAPPAEPAAQPAAAAPAEPPAPAAAKPAEPEKPKEEGYGVGQAIIDMLAFKLGFGTPIANVTKMQLASDENKRQQATHDLAITEAKKKQMIADAGRDMAGVMIAVAKPGSPYYQDATHFMNLNKSPAVKQMLGGSLQVDPTEKTNAAGEKVFSFQVVGEDGSVRSRFEATTAEAVDRFDAGQNPEAKTVLRNTIQLKAAEQNLAIEKARQFVNESYEVKRAAGIPTTEYDKYVAIKKQFPEMSDWQAREAAGLKVEDRYKPLTQYPAYSADGQVWITVMDRNEGDKIKQIPLAGMSAAAWKAGKEKELKYDINKTWPKRDDATPLENDGRDVFEAVIEGERDVNRKVAIYETVMPEFRHWLRLHPGTVDETGKDGKPTGKQRTMTPKDVRQNLDRIINETLGTGSAAAGGAAGPQWDDGSLGSYARAKAGKPEGWRPFAPQPPVSPAAGVTVPGLYRPDQEQEMAQGALAFREYQREQAAARREKTEAGAKKLEERAKTRQSLYYP